MGPVISRTLPVGDAVITFVTFDLPKHNLRAGLSAALSECDRVVGLENIARQTFFLSDDVDALELAGVVERAYGRPTPVTSYVNQCPADGHAVSCELWAFSTLSPLRRTPHVTWATTSDATWGFVGGMATSRDEPLAGGVERMLKDVQCDLRSGGLEFEQMVRTWYYIGGLLRSGDDGLRYEQFNASRNEFYRDKWPDLCRTPASTGIGMDAGQVVFEGLVVRPHAEAVDVAWLDNPLQTPPYLYDIQTKQNRKPSFSRAAAVRVADTALTFISGTASIRCSEVIHPDDPVAQTEATLENIAALVGGETLRDLQQFRVYIKQREDLNAIRDCCRACLPDAPCVYTIADVCKPDCLVEIEGVHVTTNVLAESVAASAGFAGGYGNPGLR